jgi:hypothetical protein
MSNMYALADESLKKFRRVDGTWSADYNDAEQMTLERAMERCLEVFKDTGVITEVFEVPLLAEGLYAAIDSRVDDLQARLEAAGVMLTTQVGSGDETTWTMDFGDFTLTMKLTGPDDFEVTDHED